jgi:hypothetical protein
MKYNLFCDLHKVITDCIDLHQQSLSSRALRRYIGLMIQVYSHQRQDLNVGDIFRKQVAKHPNKVCYIFEDREWTFAQVDIIGKT